MPAARVAAAAWRRPAPGVARFVPGAAVQADQAARGGRGCDDGGGLPVTPSVFGMRARTKAWRRDLDLEGRLLLP